MLELALLTLAFVTLLGPPKLLALKEGVRKGYQHFLDLLVVSG
jgi:hypothetical protein